MPEDLITTQPGVLPEPAPLTADALLALVNEKFGELSLSEQTLFLQKMRQIFTYRK